MPEHYVIIGVGPAGVAAAEAIRAAGVTVPVTLVGDEPRAPYCRSLLARVAAGEAAPAEMAWRGEDWAAKLGVCLVKQRAVRVEAGARSVELADGSRLAWSKLLLATGARPLRPPVAGQELAGIHHLYTLEDALAVAGEAAKASRAVVVGGGLAGLEAAEALRRRGLAVTVVEQAAHLLPLQLDQAAAAFLERSMREMGIEVRCGCTVAAFRSGEGGRLAGAELSSGAWVPAELVVVAAGVRPNVELLAAAGAATGRGVRVNGFLETSLPGVYAAGDVAEVLDPLTGSWLVPGRWDVAVEQGRLAGRNMAGLRQAWHPTPAAAHSGRVAGFSFVSLGLKDGEGTEAFAYRDDQGGVYRRLTLREGRLVGALLAGEVARAGIYRSYIAAGIRVGDLPALLAGRAAPPAGATARAIQ